MAKKFPKELIVKIETDSNDRSCQWFLAGETVDEMVGMNSKERLAVYKLVELREVTSGIVSQRKVRA